jgi:1-acyl-sn-glycerol-3-phosphate acyltransferase
VTPGHRRNAWFVRFGRQYVRRTLARSLDGVRVAGLDAARQIVRERPVILAANHVGWWDSFLVILLDEALGTEGYALMDAASVERMPYFAWLGALSLDRSAPRPALREAAALLDHPGRAVWIFPSGGHRPAHLRPLGFQPGVRLLTRLAPEAAVLPIAIQYAFAESPAPGAWVHLGDPVAADRLEPAVEVGLARIDGALAGDTMAFSPLLLGRNRRPDQGLGARVLARVRG